MDAKLMINLIQTDTLWEDIEGNLNRLDKKIKEIERADIILLPELFSTGFTMNAERVAEGMKGRAVCWMREVAKKKNCLVIGSLVIKENRQFYNRLVAVFPDGKNSFYDKRHLFSFAGEEKVFTAGTKRLLLEFRGFRILPLICYDLRFPVWSRNTEEIDLIIYVANWPNTRMKAWDTLLQARAIENLCYVAAVNRVGTDQNNLNYSGHSAVYDALGNQLKFISGVEEICSIELNKTHIEEVRTSYRFLDDQDQFTIAF